MTDNQITKVYKGELLQAIRLGKSMDFFNRPRHIAILHNPEQDCAVAVRFTDDGLIDPEEDENEARAEMYAMAQDETEIDWDEEEKPF